MGENHFTAAPTALYGMGLLMAALLTTSSRGQSSARKELILS